MRSLRERRGKASAGLLAAMVLVAAGCGGGHSTKTKALPPPAASTTTYPQLSIATPSSAAATSTSTTTTAGKTTTTTAKNASPPTTKAAGAVGPPPSQQAALAKLLGTYPAHSYSVSPILHTGNLTYVAVAHNIDGLSSVVDIDVYKDGAFVVAAPNIGASQSLDPVDPAAAIQTGDVTGASLPDFLVLLAAGDHDNGVLASFFGGNWHLVGTDERTGAAASPELVQPQIIGNEVTQAVNDCAPNCAQGTYSVTSYKFDPTEGELTADGPTVQSPTP